MNALPCAIITSAAICPMPSALCPYVSAPRYQWLRRTFVILASSFVIPAARAHPSDISYLKVKIERQRVEMRFTFNLLSLTRFAPGLDANQDHQIDRAELDAGRDAVLAYLGQHIQVSVNERTGTLGQAAPFECVWPVVEGKHSAGEADYPVRYVDIVFSQEVKPVLADVGLDFDIWQQTGPLGSIEATYEQDDLRTQVPFTMSAPDYLYDTGYAVEDIFQQPQKATEATSERYPAWLVPWVKVALILMVIAPLLRGFMLAFGKKK